MPGEIPVVAGPTPDCLDALERLTTPARTRTLFPLPLFGGDVMIIPLVEIEQAAVNLPLEERTHLIASLIASLDSVDESDIEAAWEREVHARSSAYHRGEVKAVPAAEALERARSSLR